MMFLCELYWQFCKDSNDEDISELKEFDMPDGSKVQVTEAEARIYAYLQRGWQIQLAFVGNVLSAFLIYQRIFDNIIASRCFYTEPWARVHKLGKGTINSLKPIPHRIIFQTRKAIKPEKCLQTTEPYGRVLIEEDEHFHTWHMPWRKDGNSTETNTGTISG